MPAKSRPKPFKLPTDRPVCRIGALTFASDEGMWRQFISANGKYCGAYAGVGARHRSARLLDSWYNAAMWAETKKRVMLAAVVDPRRTHRDGVAAYGRWWDAAVKAEARRQAFENYYWGPR